MPPRCFIFLNASASPEPRTLSLHDALPIFNAALRVKGEPPLVLDRTEAYIAILIDDLISKGTDRKSTRLNSSHANISYAVVCLKKKKALDGLLAGVPHAAMGLKSGISGLAT